MIPKKQMKDMCSDSPESRMDRYEEEKKKELQRLRDIYDMGRKDDMYIAEERRVRVERYSKTIKKGKTYDF